MTNYYQEIEDRHVYRLWKTLQKTINGKPVTRAQLAKRASTITEPVTPARVTALHSRLEQLATESGYYLNRPLLGTNTYSLSEHPYAAALAGIARWRNWTSRARKDAEVGTMLQKLAVCGDTDIERWAQRVLMAYEAALDADKRIADEMEQLAVAVKGELTA